MINFLKHRRSSDYLNPHHDDTHQKILRVSSPQNGYASKSQHKSSGLTKKSSSYPRLSPTGMSFHSNSENKRVKNFSPNLCLPHRLAVLAMLVQNCRSEEQSILVSAAVSNTDIDASVSADQGILINDAYKQWLHIESSSETDGTAEF